MKKTWNLIKLEKFQPYEWKHSFIRTCILRTSIKHLQVTSRLRTWQSRKPHKIFSKNGPPKPSLFQYSKNEYNTIQALSSQGSPKTLSNEEEITFFYKKNGWDFGKKSPIMKIWKNHS